MDSPRHSPAHRYYRIIGGILLIVMIVDLSYIAARKFARPQITVTQSSNAAYSVTIDPNVASQEDLECIPGIDRKLARLIVDYRTEYHRRFPDRVVFAGIEDLKRVKGLTERTLSQAGAFLMFPGRK